MRIRIPNPLLAATAPERFAGIAAHVHRELTYAGAYLRRQLFALAPYTG